MTRIAASLVLFSLAACSVNLDNIPCDNDGECETGATCVAHKCVVSTCTDGELSCGGSCTALGAPPNCSSCGDCIVPDGGTAMCSSMVCRQTPATVTGLTAVLGSSSVALTWNKVDLADSYSIARNTATMGTFGQIGTSTLPAYVDHTDAGTTYFYEVTATINGVPGQPSSPASAGSSLAAPQGLNLVQAAPDSIQIGWGMVTGATGYSITRSTDGTTYHPLANTQSPGYTDEAVEPGTHYWYEVAGTIGPLAGQVSAALETTTTLATPSLTNSGGGTISWNQVTNATGYNVSTSSDNGATFTPVGSQTPTTSGTSIQLSGTPGTAYIIHVVAVNAIASSAPGAINLVDPLGAPALSLDGVGGTTASFHWSVSPGATSYQLMRIDDTNGNGTYSPVGSPTSSTSQSDSTLVYTDVYSYAVTASNGVSGASSSVSNILTVQLLAGPVQNFQSTVPNSTSIFTSWTPLSTPVDGYLLQIQPNGGSYTNVTSSNPTTTNSSFTIGGLSPGTQYLVRVAAITGPPGNLVTGAFTTEGTTTTVDAPALNAPTIASSTQINLNWSSNGASGLTYVLTATPAGQAALTSVQTSNSFYNYSGLQPGTQYSFSVVAMANSISSGGSNVVTAITPLDAPQLSSSNLTSTSVTLTWTPPINATTYLIARSQNGGSFTPNPSGTQTTNSQTDNSIVAGTSYSYEVTATNSVFTAGTVSNVVQVVSSLSVPTNLAVAPLSSSSAKVTWDPASGATGYNLQRSTNGGGFVNINANTPSVLSSPYTDSNLTSGTSVSYKVQSYNGNTSAFSAPSTSVAIPLDPPGHFSANYNSGNGSAALTWDANSFATSGYIILRAVNSGAFAQYATPTNNSFTDTGPLTSGSQYSYEVEAATGVATSAPSSAQVSVPLGSASLTITGATSSTVTLGWGTPVPNANQMQIWRAPSPTSTFVQIGSTPNGTAVSYTDTTGAGTIYDYYVIAVNTATNITGPASSTVQVTTPLDAPVISSVVLTDSHDMTVMWNAPTNATGYDLQESSNGGASWSDLGQEGSTTGIDTAISPGLAYVYRVSANNSTGASSAFSVTSHPAVLNPLLAPANFSLTQTPATPTTVTASWAQAAGATGYIVSRSPSGTAGTYVTLGTGTPTTTALSYTDNTVTGGTQYFYQVQAYTTTTTGPGATASVTTPLAAPSPLTASYNAVTAKVSLSWGSVAGAAMYAVSRSTDGHTFSNLITQGTTSYQDAPPTGHQFFYYEITASNAVALPTTGEMALVYIPPNTPAGLTFNASTLGQVLLTWNSEPTASNGYNVLRSTDGGLSYSIIGFAGNATFIDYNVVLGTSYRYEIQSVAFPLLSAPSAPVGPVTLSGSAAPVNLRITATSPGSITVAWNALATQPGGYHILRSNDGFSYFITGAVAGTQTTFTDLNVFPGNTYWYEVQGAAGGTSGAAATTEASAALMLTDADVPQPKNLVVASGPTPGSVSLQWDPVSAATSYIADYSLIDPPTSMSWTPVLAQAHCTSSTDCTGTSTVCANTLCNSPSTTVTDTTNLTPGQPIWYSVRAFVGNLWSLRSDPIRVVDPMNQLSGIGTSLVASAELGLFWNLPPGGAPGYSIYRTDPINATPTFVGSSATNIFFDTSVSPNTTYQYAIAPSSPSFGEGPRSQPSNGFSTLIAPNPAPPVNFNAGAESATDILLKYDPPSAENPVGYTIIRGTDPNYFPVTFATSASQYDDTTVLGGTTYYYKIQANYTGINPGAFSSVAMTTTPPSPPVLTAAGGGTQVTLNWTAPVGANGYFVFRATSPFGPFSEINFTQNTSMTDLSLNASTTYYYLVTATGAASSSLSSNTASVITDPNSATGRVLATYETGDQNLSSNTLPAIGRDYGVRAFVPPQSGAAWTIINGLSSADGYFTIPSIPAGNYFLHVPNFSHTWTSSRAFFDYSYYTPGNSAENAPTIQPSYLDLTVSGIDSWASTDLLEVVSFAGNIFLYNALNEPPGGSGPGSTSGVLEPTGLTLSTVYDLTTGGSKLSLQGDDMYASQLENFTSSNGLPYISATRYAHAGPFYDVDGQSSLLGMTLADQTATTPVQPTLNWKRSAWKAYTSAMNPNAQNNQDFINVGAIPHANVGGFYAGSLDFLIANPTVGANDLNYGTVKFWQIYPSSWDIYGLASSQATVEYSLPGSTTPAVLPVAISYQDMGVAFANNMATGTFAPPLTPVQNPTIQGQNAFAVNENVGIAPTISWQAPAVGTPSLYEVTVYNVIVNSSQATVLKAQGGWRTQSTSITFPVDSNGANAAFQTGVPSVVTIRAIYAPGFSLSSPNLAGIVVNTADCASNIFMP